MILAIDPGSDKTGMAVLYEDGRLQWKGIVPSPDVEKEAAAALRQYHVSAVVMGNGTRHREMKARLEKVLAERDSSLTVTLVDEKYTTEMGKARYWEDHKPKGWMRLLPKGMRTIPVPVDDYVAWIIGQIYLGLARPEDVGHKKV